jgi:transposase
MESATVAPKAIRCALEGYADRLRRVGHEAGALSPRLHRGLERLGLKMVLLETRRVQALKAQRNRQERRVGGGAAGPLGLVRDVHVKSEVSYRLRLLLTRTGGRSSAKFLDHENEIRHSLKVFGVKLSAVGRVGFEARVRELIGADALLAALTEPVLRARAALWSEYSKLHALPRTHGGPGRALPALHGGAGWWR